MYLVLYNTNIYPCAERIYTKIVIRYFAWWSVGTLCARLVRKSATERETESGSKSAGNIEYTKYAYSGALAALALSAHLIQLRKILPQFFFPICTFIILGLFCVFLFLSLPRACVCISSYSFFHFFSGPVLVRYVSRTESRINRWRCICEWVWIST